MVCSQEKSEKSKSVADWILPMNMKLHTFIMANDHYRLLKEVQQNDFTRFGQQFFACTSYFQTDTFFSESLS